MAKQDLIRLCPISVLEAELCRLNTYFIFLSCTDLLGRKNNFERNISALDRKKLIE